MRMEKDMEIDALTVPSGELALLEGKVRRVAVLNQFATTKPAGVAKGIAHSQFDTTALADFAAEKTKRLTARQGEVFNLAMQGLKTKEIARVLGLSYRPVEPHRAHILRRLGYSAFFELLQEMLGSNRR